MMRGRSIDIAIARRCNVERRGGVSRTLCLDKQDWGMVRL